MLKFFHKFLHRLHGPKQLVTARLQSEMVWSFQTAILPPDCLLHRKFVCLQLVVVQTPAKLGKNEKIESGWSNAPDVLCFACPCLLAYFREVTNLHCAHEASPCFLLEGGPCLLGLAQNTCYQATIRPVPLESGVVYTPFWHHIPTTLHNSHRLPPPNREKFDQISPPQPTKASHTLMPQLFFRPLYSFLPHLCCILCFGSIGTAKIKLRRGLFCLSGQKPLKAHSYMIFKVVVQASVAA